MEKIYIVFEGETPIFASFLERNAKQIAYERGLEAQADVLERNGIRYPTYEQKEAASYIAGFEGRYYEAVPGWLDRWSQFVEVPGHGKLLAKTVENLLKKSKRIFGY